MSHEMLCNRVFAADIPGFNFCPAGEAFQSKQFLASFNHVFIDLWLNIWGISYRRRMWILKRCVKDRSGPPLSTATRSAGTNADGSSRAVECVRAGSLSRKPTPKRRGG